MREEGYGIMELEEWVVEERWAWARRRARINLLGVGESHGGLPGDGREGDMEVEEEAQQIVRDALEEERRAMWETVWRAIVEAERRGGGAP